MTCAAIAAERMIYLDTSAAIKALIAEDDTKQVRALFGGDEQLISSRLLAVELHAVAQRRRLEADAVSELIDHVALVSLSDDVAERAIVLRSGLRTLDALHLATAIDIDDIVTAFAAYDIELRRAASRAGLPLWAPSES